GGGLRVDAEVTYQVLPRVGVKLRLELGPNVVVTPNQQLLAAAPLKMSCDGVGNDLEVLHGFIRDAPLDVAGIVATPSVTPSVASKFVDEVELLNDYAVGNLKDASLGAVDQCDAGMLH